MLVILEQEHYDDARHGDQHRKHYRGDDAWQRDCRSRRIIAQRDGMNSDVMPNAAVRHIDTMELKIDRKSSIMG